MHNERFQQTSDTTPPCVTTSTTYTNGSGICIALTLDRTYRFDNFSIWNKNSTVFSSLAGATPWTLEAVMASDNAAGTAYISLFNKTTSAQVTASESTVTGTTLNLVQTSLSDAAANFTNGDDFEVKLKSNNASYAANLYKAGIWVSLQNLTKAQIYYLVMGANDLVPGSMLGGTSSMTLFRSLLNLSAFTNPAVYFESIATWVSAGTGTVQTIDGGVNDSGTSGTAVANSNLTFTATKSRQRSSALSLTSDNRYMGSAVITTGEVRTSGGFIIVNVSP